MSKTILITGATSGIGLATAKIFAANKFNLIITGRRADRLEEISTSLQNEYQVQVTSLCFDIRSYLETEVALNSLPDEKKDIDVLLNNAGLAMGFAPINEGVLDDWETMIDTNIKGLLYVTKIVSNWMKKKQAGHIINIGSSAGKEVYPNGNVYCATKHAVDALSKAMRLDLYKYGIKVTGVCPGHVETEFALVRHKGNEENASKTYQGFKPLSAMDVAEIIYFAATRPLHVNIQDILMFSSDQASAQHINRTS